MISAIVNSERGAACIGEISPFIGKLVNVIKVKKNGLYLVELNEDPAKTVSIPKYNLDFIEKTMSVGVRQFA